MTDFRAERRGRMGEATENIGFSPRTLHSGFRTRHLNGSPATLKTAEHRRLTPSLGRHCRTLHDKKNEGRARARPSGVVPLRDKGRLRVNDKAVELIGNEW